MRLEAEIRQQAAALGFSACGFAAAAPLGRGAFLEGWLDAGFAGEMRYLERRAERRLSVAGMLRHARTVITLAYPYDPPPPAPIDWRHELRGRIAAYALGEDYHRVLERKLAALEAFIATCAPRTRTRRTVDTGAILEREWALRAGLGWFGKNTMLLSTRAGSWFFLAELVTTVALMPDPPVAARCGRCTRCGDACPTGALRDGLVMDARLCISYLTIEHRGPIPPDLAPALGDWLFGCDVCQEVCPHNRRAAPGGPSSFQADARYAAVALADLLRMDEARWRATFLGAPLWRAKRAGLLRNALIVAANTDDADALAAARELVGDPDSTVAETARRVVARARRP